MSVNKINPVYSVPDKQPTSEVSANEWNNLNSAVTTAQTKINNIIDELNSNPGSNPNPSTPTPSSDSHISINNKGNLTIETTEADKVNDKGGKINIEPVSDLQIKPGDDINLYSHHRQGKEDEVAVKVLNGSGEVLGLNGQPVSGRKQDDYPVKLQLNVANIQLTTKDKDRYIVTENTKRQIAGKDPTSDAAHILNVEAKTGVSKENASPTNHEYAYVKLRGQAFDIRCEEHGGIALQPKGTDNEGHENKIKFEHGGGDGLEFGTFNTKVSSLFTREYRFNKSGIWRVATRETEASDKYDSSDNTTALKYVKQADDFYDIIDPEDASATTNDIIKTAAALNGDMGIHTKRTSKGNLEIASEVWIEFVPNATADAQISCSDLHAPSDFFPTLSPTKVKAIFSGNYTEGETSEPIYTYGCNLDTFVKSLQGANPSDSAAVTAVVTQINAVTDGTCIELSNFMYGTAKPGSDYTRVSSTVIVHVPNINLESKGKLSLKGILDFGSSFQFGETDDGIEVQYKLTKKGATKDCGVLKVVGVNNHSSQVLSIDGTDIQPGNTATIAQCSILDVIKLVNYMKTNNLGPWTV